MKKRICIIIPAFNESLVIASVLKDLRKSLSQSKFNFTIVVVNDGSSDKTGLVAEGAGVEVVNHILNSGAGSATATGLCFADRNNFDIAVTMDADGQHSPKDVVNGIKMIMNKKTDLLIGSRLINTQGMSGVKILGNKGLSTITRVFFGVNVTDSQSGLRLFSKDAISRLRWKSSGYEFCSEMLWRAKQANLKIEEYPIEAIYTDYSRSKGQSNWNAINIVKSLLRSRLMEIFE